MEKGWATSGVDLHLDLNREASRTGHGIRARLEAALRDAVRTGRLGPGTRPPSSRALAPDPGVARNTVAEAYGQLVAEGWLTARQGSGTRVADRVARLPGPAARSDLAARPDVAAAPPGPHDARPPRYTLKA